MEATGFLYANGVTIYQIKAKISEIKPYPLCLAKFQKILQLTTCKNAVLNEYAYDFSVDYNTIDVSDIVDIHKYFMKKHNVK